MEISSEYGNFKDLMQNYDRLYSKSYPNGLDLKPGSKAHDDILNKLLDRSRLGSDEISKRIDSWRYMDDVLNVYVPMDATERKIKQNDPRKPVVVVVPESYSTLDTLMTYDVASYVKKPFFEYEPVGPEDVVAATLLSFYTDYNIELFDLILNLHTWWRDAKVYGVGVVGAYWTKEPVMRRAKKRDLLSMIKDLYGGTSRPKRTHKEGSIIINFDPYNMQPDPGTPMEKVAKSRFFGWVEPGDRMNVYDMASEGDTFNLKYIAHMSCGESKFKHSGLSGRQTQIGDNVDIIDTDPFDITHQYVQLVPSMWKLGDSDKPERWMFSTVGDAVIIRAKKMDDFDDGFPLAAMVPNYDGRTLLPLSPLEINGGMQGYIDWLLRTRVASVRRDLANTVVTDPLAINMMDFEKPGPIRFVRTTRAARGRNIDTMIKQLTFNDFTANHIGDIAIIRNLMAESSASVDLTRGTQQRSGERVTSTEISTRYRGATSRLAKTAKMMSILGHKPLAEIFARNLINKAESSVFVKVTGEFTRRLIMEYGLERRFDRGFLRIDPDDIDVDFNVITSIGEISWLQDSNVWLRMLELMVNSPLMVQTFDIVRIIKHIARIEGIKNVDEFVQGGVDIQTVPDQQALAQRQQGNLVTGGQYGGATQTVATPAQSVRAARGR